MKRDDDNKTLDQLTDDRRVAVRSLHAVSALIRELALMVTTARDNPWIEEQFPTQAYQQALKTAYQDFEDEAAVYMEISQKVHDAIEDMAPDEVEDWAA